MTDRWILDTYCGAGGATKGWQRAGFKVRGVDINPQTNYCGDDFVQADALVYLRELIRFRRVHPFVGVHASPPCQRFTPLSKSWNGRADEHPDLVDETRRLLEALGLPYVIENVVGAPLRDHAVKLCGSMFDLAVERHRLFEANFPLPQPACDHARQAALWPNGFPALRSDRSKRARVVGVFGTGGGAAKDLETWKWAMGIDWMKTKHELAEAIPPAYTAWVGRQLLAHINTEVKAA